MGELLDQFECVRIVRMNGIDLNLFQFDYDQTWAVLFFRHDGTLLARYGTRDDANGMKYNSPEGLSAAMRRVLTVDRNWESEWQPYYTAKLGPRSPHATADEIPSKTIDNIRQRGNADDSRKSCIHCHNVYDAQRDFAISSGEYDPATRYKYPLPERIGLTMDDSGLIEQVWPDSPAAKQGLKAGDRVHRINGQNIHSIADVQFALHYVADPGSIQIETYAAESDMLDPPKDRLKSAILALHNGWRKADISWRVSMYGMPPSPGLWIQALTDEEKAEAGIAGDKLALKVRGVFGADVRRSGLKKDDLIVKFGNDSSHHAPGEFHARLRLGYYRPNSKLPLKIVRDGKAMDLTVTFMNEDVTKGLQQSN